MEDRPAAVSQAAKQAGEVRARWGWAEPSVWTERMLTALETGVKGGQWFSLIDKVYATGTLQSAFARVKANRGAAGVDHQSIERFEAHLDEELRRLSESLREGTYKPQAVRRVSIPKPGGKGERPLGIPTVRDRVAQTALRTVLEPIFERDFAEHSYGFRPGRGCKDALRRVDALLKQGFTQVVDADLKSYFDTLDHRRLMACVEAKVSDGRLLSLVASYLTAEVMETHRSWTPEAGSPQGAVISPLLSNIYLDELDHTMRRAGLEMVRYADDFVILCRSRAEADQALDRVRRWVDGAGLTLHPEKTRIVDMAGPGGFDFLGYHFEQGRRRPSRKSLRKFKEAVRDQTRRTSGQSLSRIIVNLNRTLQGWLEYFKHSHVRTFGPLDAWVRMRLRSILRSRRGLRGRGRGQDHLRWKNAFFAEQGLFSLSAAHARERQSYCR